VLSFTGFSFPEADVVTFGLVAALVAAVTLLAAYILACAASRINPTETLRGE